jgi:hypothetical protein
MSGKKREADPLQGWEIPASSAPSQDPWRAPGHGDRVPAAHPASSSAPFSCRFCGKGLSVREAYAYDGELYCAACRPPKAVSGARDLPPDPLPGRDLEDAWDVPKSRGKGRGLVGALLYLIDLLTDL